MQHHNTRAQAVCSGPSLMPRISQNDHPSNRHMRITIKNIFAILLTASIMIGTAGLAAESLRVLSR